MICLTVNEVIGFLAISLGVTVLITYLGIWVGWAWRVKRFMELEAAVQAFGHVSILADKAIPYPISKTFPVVRALSKITSEQWKMVRKGKS